MKLLDIGIKELKDRLSDEQTVEILKEDLLAIRLREQIFTPTDDKIKNNKLCMETSAQLGQGGKYVFWLLAGGLMESTAKLTKMLPGSSDNTLGFSANGLIDFSMLHPYAFDTDEMPERILKDHSVDLPFTAENAKNLVPGATFQIMGCGTANLSVGVTVRKSVASAQLSHKSEVNGTFAVRIIRDRNTTIRVVLSQVTERKRDTSLTAKVSLSLDLGTIIPNTWVETLEDKIDDLNLEKLTAEIPGLGDDLDLSEYIKAEGIDKGISKLGDFIKNYQEFYATLGHKSSQKQKTLVSYEFDLAATDACKAFEALLHLDDTKAEELANQESSGIIRQSYSDSETLGEHYSALGFPGKKMVLASTLRSEREGTLIFDGNTKIIRQKLLNKKYAGIITGSKEITWEGFDIILNNNPTKLGYWHFSFTHIDKIATNKEIVRFCRFAELLGADPIEEGQIESLSFVKKIFSKKDNTSLLLDLYFTKEGLTSIATSKKNQLRQLCFSTASYLGDIAPDAPWQNQKARALMNAYNKTRYDLTGERAFDQTSLQKQYDQLGGTLQFGHRDLSKDSAILNIVTLLWENLEPMMMMEDDKATNLKGWQNIFANIGESAKFEYMIIIAVLASRAEPNETLLDKLEFKRSKNNKILVQFDEERDIATADAIFNQASNTMIS